MIYLGLYTKTQYHTAYCDCYKNLETKKNPANSGIYILLKYNRHYISS